MPHPNAVRLALEAQREARQESAPVAVQLSAKTRLRDTVIHAHPLASYDQLGSTASDSQAQSQTEPETPRRDSDESKK